MDYVVLPSRRGGAIYYVVGERCCFVQYSSRGETRYLKCREKNCPRRLVLSDRGLESRDDSDHDHADDHEHEYEAFIAYDSMKERVKDIRIPLRTIHREGIRDLSIRAKNKLSWKKVQVTLKRVRKNLFPPCTDIQALVRLLENEETPSEFAKFREDEFYRGTVGCGEDENGEIKEMATIFVLEKHYKEALLYHENNLHLSVDGTFLIVPLQYKQLFIVFAKVLDHLRPLAYVLMTHKTKNLYQEVFEHLRDGLLLNPGMVVI